MTIRSDDAATIIRDLLNDLLSPFPREVVVVARLGRGDTSIERARAYLAALNPSESR